MDKRSGGKPGGFKKSGGSREGGERSARPYAKREGGYERKPRGEGREGGYERKERSFGERSERPARPSSQYGSKREGGFDRKPREGGYERKLREFGDRPARPYVKREGSEGGERAARPYAKREGGFERKPREGGYERKPREFGDRPARPYAKREGGFDRKPREGGYERKPREFGERSERPARAYAPREGGFERKPREEGDFRPRENRGEGKPARFAAKRVVKHEREPILNGDGWLVGYHTVVAALTAGRRKVRAVWLLGEAKGELADVLAAHPEWPVEVKAKPDFEREFGELVHQGVAALVGNLPQPSLPELLAGKPKLLVALDQVTDPHNLGAIVRSCAAFGVQGVLVTEHRSAGLNATAAKAAAGAMENVPVVEITNLAQAIEMLKENGFTVMGLAGEAEDDIADVSVSGPLCLIVGSEGDGLRRLTREHCDKLVKIAITGVESLNVSVATGVALYGVTRKK